MSENVRFFIKKFYLKKRCFNDECTGVSEKQQIR